MRAAVLIETPRTGAGMDFVKICEKYNIHPIIFIANPEAQPDWVLDEFYERKVDIRKVNSYDINEATEHCRAIKEEYELIAVLSLYEYSTIHAAKIAKSLGLRSPEPEIVSTFRSKSSFRKFLDENNLNSVNYQIKNMIDIDTGEIELNYPLVVKPVNLTGSAFVRKCNNQVELNKAFHEIQSLGEYTGQKVENEILVEEYIDGDEYSVEILNGEIVTIVQKYIGEPGFIEIGHDLPANITVEREKLIYDKIAELIKTSNYYFGILHLELKVNKNGVQFIEANPRVAGGRIPELIRQVYGIDIIENYLLSLFRQQIKDGKSINPINFASIRFRVAKEHGVLESYNKLSLDNYPSIIEYKFYKTIGENFEINYSNKDRVLHAISISESITDNEKEINQFFGDLEIKGCAL